MPIAISSSSPLLLPKPKPSWVISCCSEGQHKYKVPKLEAFSRSKLERGLKDPPLIAKSETQLSDYCTVLDGQDSYSCWQAYFELKDLQKHFSQQDIEKLIIESGGIKSLIACLHGVASIHKATNPTTHASINPLRPPSSHMHVPDGLPKTPQEILEEENAMMPDSPYTRLLRRRGTHPAWYSPPPDHQTH